VGRGKSRVKFGLPIHVGSTAIFSVQPDEYADCGDFEWAGLEIDSRESLRDVVCYIGSVIHSPGYTGSRDDRSDLFFEMRLHE
jgi:hypothetical protein